MAAASFTDQNRICQVTSPLGPDMLLLQRMTGEEAISRPFRFECDFLSERDDIAFTDIVGKPVTIAMEQPDQKIRYFNGFVSRFAQRNVVERFVSYRAELVPWLWFLTRTSDCRIFQKKTVPAILQQVFQDLGFTDFQMEANGQGQREYCVQYRETDFNFVSRLMEEEGIRYWFEHENGEHIMRISDAASNPDLAAYPEVQCSSDEAAGRSGEVREWLREEEFAPGKHAHDDYNFETPSQDLVTETKTVLRFSGNSGFEIYDYPGEFPDKSKGSSLSKLRMEAEEAAAIRIHGASDIGALEPGRSVKLVNHYRDDFNGKKYLLTEVSHTVTQGVGYEDASSSYENWFSCSPADMPYRPTQLTPKPVVQGVQTAVVTGPKGEEIYPDKYGRVKVQFHWDREGNRDENSSCWIRVAQLWAGNGYGAISIPRIGDEVVVSFLEGDPDRPLITGRVYNAENKVPYELPNEKTKFAIKSHSSKGGGGMNELRFEDLKGKEQVFMHAEKDMDLRVKNVRKEYVGSTTHLIVGGSQKEKVSGKKSVDVGSDQMEKIGGSQSLDVAADQDVKVGMKSAVDAGMEIHLKAGMKVVIESGLQLSLKAAGGFIDIGPAGVSISGIMVNINSGGAAGAGSGASPTAPEAPAEAEEGKV